MLHLSQQNPAALFCLIQVLNMSIHTYTYTHIYARDDISVFTVSDAPINRPVSHSLAVAWLSGAKSCSTSGPVSTWMGDHLQASKPSPYIATHLGQLSLPSLQGRLIKSRLSGWG